MFRDSEYSVILFYSNSNSQSLRARVAINEFASENFRWAEMTIREVDYDRNKHLAHEHGVQGTPAVLFFKNGSLIRRHLGEITSAEVQSIMRKL